MHVHMERSIAAPAAIAWQILGPEFAEIDTWASFVRTSQALQATDAPTGMTIAAGAPVAGRKTKTKATLSEFITAYSAEDMSLTFEAAGLPPIVKRGRDVQTVRSTGDTTSTLTFEIDFDFLGPFAILGPIMRRRIVKSIGSTMDDLATEAERRHSLGGDQGGNH